MKKIIINSFFLIFSLLLIFSHKAESKSDLNIGVKGVPTSEKPFVIVIPSYNNEAYCKRNLESLFKQKYSNWRAIYIDDASSDETYRLAKEMIENWDFQDRVTLIHNSENLGAMHNLYTSIHSCENYEIIVTLDGDDWLKHSLVLKTLNEYYANEDTWLTYGQYERYPDGSLGCPAPVKISLLKEGNIRTKTWVYSHLRSFYAGLFKRIKLKDFLYNGKFFRATYDLAMMFPMIEMAREHVFYLPEISYVYNYSNPLNDSRVRQKEQEMLEKYIRSLPTYPKLLSHPANPFLNNEEEI